MTFMKTVENRLSSLCRNIANQIEESTVNSEDYSVPDIFSSMSECLDLDHAYNFKTTDFGADALTTMLKVSCTDQ